MQRKYEVFMMLIHEYIHMLEHPFIPEATGQSIVVREGVCEWLTCQVIKALADGEPEFLQEIVTTVEGEAVLKKVRERALALRDFLAAYKPKQDYADYVSAVEKVRNLCGEDGIKAAFFQGHVEFFGIRSDGSWFDGVIKKNGTRSIPNVASERLPDLASFANATGLTVQQIVHENPDLGKPMDQWPYQIFLPGYHAHYSIFFPDDLVETWKKIAAQHDVDEQQVKDANLITGDQAVPVGAWLLVPD